MNESKLPQKPLDQAIDAYQNPAVKAIAALTIIGTSVTFPITGAVMAAANELLNWASSEQVKRRKIFLDELDTKNTPIDERILKTPEFIHFLKKAYLGALNSYSEEKIRRFAKMLKGIASTNMFEKISEREEYLIILGELSDREWQLLLFMSQNAESLTPSQEDDDLKTNVWSHFQKEALTKFNLKHEELIGIINRLKAKGLCAEYGDLRLGDHFPICFLTTIYFNIRRLVENAPDN